MVLLLVITLRNDHCMGYDGFGGALAGRVVALLGVGGALAGIGVDERASRPTRNFRIVESDGPGADGNVNGTRSRSRIDMTAVRTSGAEQLVAETCAFRSCAGAVIPPGGSR